MQERAIMCQSKAASTDTKKLFKQEQKKCRGRMHVFSQISSYVGQILLKSRSSSEMSTKLNKMAGFPLSQRVVVYKDVKFDPTFICEAFDKTLSYGVIRS